MSRALLIFALLVALGLQGVALAQGGLITPGGAGTPANGPAAAPANTPAAAPAAPGAGTPTPGGAATAPGASAPRAGRVAGQAKPKKPSPFQEAWARLMAWWRKEMLFLLCSLLGLYVVVCLLSWILGRLAGMRPLAAPPTATLIGFFLWAGFVVYFTLFRALGAAFFTLNWAFWLILGVFAFVVILLLGISLLRRVA